MRTQNVRKVKEFAYRASKTKRLLLIFIRLFQSFLRKIVLGTIPPMSTLQYRKLMCENTRVTRCRSRCKSDLPSRIWPEFSMFSPHLSDSVFLIGDISRQFLNTLPSPIFIQGTSFTASFSDIHGNAGYEDSRVLVLAIIIMARKFSHSGQLLKKEKIRFSVVWNDHDNQ